MSKSTWTGAINSHWGSGGNWSPAGVPDADSNVVIASGAPVASASIGTVNSIIDSSYLAFESAGTNRVTTFLDNTGSLNVDDSAGEGGTILNIGGTLTNSNSLSIGNATLTAPDKVTAAALDNTATGSIHLTGSRAKRALLDIKGSAGFGAAGVLSGNVELAGDSAIEFKAGRITSLAGVLALTGKNAFIEDSSALESNSALMGLASIFSFLELENGASVSTTGALVNHAALALDQIGGHGGSSLTVAGALTNSGGGISIGCGDLSASDKLTAASLDNTKLGVIELTGSGANQALLDVTAGRAGFGATGVLSDTVKLNDDSAIEFASGQITSLALDAELDLSGSDAFIEDSTALGSNSALTGLASIGARAQLRLENGASVSTTGSVTNSGDILLDWSLSFGGSSLNIGGALTNTGVMEIGNSQISSSDPVTAKSFVNSGTVELTGGTNFAAAINVSGATTNNGSIYITDDTEELAGAVDGAGSFGLFTQLSNANLQLDSSVSAGQTINEGAPGEKLTLEQAQNFAATISGFGTGDTIDAANFLLSATTCNFVENTSGTGGTLTLHDAGLTANILMTGSYSKSDFTLAPDHGTGTRVNFE